MIALQRIEKRRVWTIPETLAFLNLYKSHLNDFKFAKNRKIVFTKILAELNTLGVLERPTTEAMLENKITCMFRAFKRSLEDPHSTPYACIYPFMTEVGEIYNHCSSSIAKVSEQTIKFEIDELQNSTSTTTDCDIVNNDSTENEINVHYNEFTIHPINSPNDNSSDIIPEIENTNCPASSMHTLNIGTDPTIGLRVPKISTNPQASESKTSSAVKTLSREQWTHQFATKCVNEKETLLKNKIKWEMQKEENKQKRFDEKIKIIKKIEKNKMRRFNALLKIVNNK